MNRKNSFFRWRYGRYVTTVMAILLTIGMSACTWTRDETDESDVVRTVMSEEDVDTAYRKAQSAYLWFSYEPLAYWSYVKVKTGRDTSEELGPKSLNGLDYYKSVDEHVTTYNRLRCYLRTIFSEEISEELLNGENSIVKYTDFDNRLYGTVPEQRPASKVSNESRTIEKVNDYRYLYHVTVELFGDDGKTVDRTENYDCIYEYFNDRWIFTQFNLIY